MRDLHLVLDKSTGRYAVQLADELRRAIRTGRLAPGSRLPASRALAADLGVARGVVVDAYDQLVAEGFLIARQGDATRVADRPGVLQSFGTPASDPESDRPAVRYDLRPGTPAPSEFPRRGWHAALRRALADLPDDELGYPPYAGAGVLRATLADYLGRVRAADVTSDRVVVLSGVAQGLSAMPGIVARSGRRTPNRDDRAPRIAVESPGSPGAWASLRAAGAELVEIPVDAEGIEVARLADVEVDAVLVTPAHQYPTGVVLSPARRAALVDWARSSDRMVFEDDYDAEFRYDREPIGCLQGLAPDHVVLFGSVSKPLAPALRLGWAVAPPPWRDAFVTHRAMYDLGSPAIEQYALADFIASGAYDRHLRAMRRTYRRRRDAFVAALAEHVPDAVVHGVSAGIHLYAELPGVDADRLAERAAEHGVALQPAGRSAFALGYSKLAERHLVDAVTLLGRLLRSGSVL